MALRFLSSKAKLFRVPSNATTPDDWVSMPYRRKIGLKLGQETADVTAEDSEGYKDEQAILKIASLDVEALIGEDPTADANYLALHAAYDATPSTPVEFAIVFGDKSVVGTKYVQFPINISIDVDLDEKNPTTLKFSGNKAPGTKPTLQAISA